MSRNLPFAAVAAALALAACGIGPQAHAAATPRPSADPVQVYRQLSQCVRDHGRPDFPDPVLDANGKPSYPDGTEKPSPEILAACQSILDQLPAPDRSRTASHPDAAMMRRFAQCMREHGIDDWPDPDADGRFTFPPSLAGNLKTGPRWPQIQAAWNGSCRQYNPTGHIESTN